MKHINGFDFGFLPGNHIESFFQSHCHLISKQRRHCVANLVELMSLGAAKFEPIRKTLQAGSLTHLDATTATVWQFHTLHITGSTRKVSTGDSTCRAVGM